MTSSYYLHNFTGDGLSLADRIVAFQVASKIRHAVEAEGFIPHLYRGLAAVEQINAVETKSDRRKIGLQYNPSFHAQDRMEANAAFVVIRTPEDVPVAAVGGILSVVFSDLASELEQLRHFYDDPETMRQPGDICTVASPLFRSIRSCHIGFQVALWAHHDFSRPGNLMPTAAIRLCNLFILAHWPVQYIVAIAKERVIRDYAWKKAGYPEMGPGVGLPMPGLSYWERHRWAMRIAREDALRIYLNPRAADLGYGFWTDPL